MRRHGWAGDMPHSDAEAKERIVTAARRAIDLRGAVSVSEVATALGVARQTVYRYFPTHEALMAGTAVAGVSGFLDRVAGELGAITDPAEAVVEGIAYTLEQLADDKYLSLVLEPGKANAFTATVTSDVAISLGRAILHRFDVDWAAGGFDDDKLDELVEVMLRMLQSLIIDPGRPVRHASSLRNFLRDWIAPSVRAHSRKARLVRPDDSHRAVL